MSGFIGMNTQWNNKNRYRHYPFYDDSDFRLASEDGSVLSSTVYMPTWVLTDFFLVSSAMSSSWPVVYLKGFSLETINGNKYVKLTFRLIGNEATDIVAETITAPGEYHVVSGTAVHSDGNAYFRCTFGFEDTEVSNGIEDGVYTFYNEPKILSTRIAHCAYGEITSLQGKTGKIYLVPGKYTEWSVADGQLYLSVGANRGVRVSQHEAKNQCDSTFMFLNSQGADSSGNVTIYGGAGVDVISDGALINGVPTITIQPTPQLKQLIDGLS